LFSKFNWARKNKHAIYIEHAILGATDLEAIMNDFRVQKMRRHDKKHTVTDQGHFSEFVTKYSIRNLKP